MGCSVSNGDRSTAANDTLSSSSLGVVPDGGAPSELASPSCPPRLLVDGESSPRHDDLNIEVEQVPLLQRGIPAIERLSASSAPLQDVETSRSITQTNNSGHRSSRLILDTSSDGGHRGGPPSTTFLSPVSQNGEEMPRLVGRPSLPDAAVSEQSQSHVGSLAVFSGVDSTASTTWTGGRQSVSLLSADAPGHPGSTGGVRHVHPTSTGNAANRSTTDGFVREGEWGGGEEERILGLELALPRFAMAS